MSSKVTFDYSKAMTFIKEHEIDSMKEIVGNAKDVLVSGTGAGNDYIGWVNLPVDYDKEEFARIQKAAEKIQSDSEVLIVIGIGGSYLGARAAIEFLRHGFYNNVSKEIRKTPEIYYAGNSISSTYLKGLIDVIGDRDFSVNIISKSGTTTEPAIAFRVFKEMLEKKYGQEDLRHHGQGKGSPEEPGYRGGLRVLRCAGRCRRTLLRSDSCGTSAHRSQRRRHREADGGRSGRKRAGAEQAI